MKVINTFNIFEASYYLTYSGNTLKEAFLTGAGLINYSINCNDESGKMISDYSKGLASIHLQSYLSKFQSLYQKSLVLKDDESFMEQGGLL